MALLSWSKTKKRNQERKENKPYVVWDSIVGEIRFWCEFWVQRLLTDFRILLIFYGGRDKWSGKRCGFERMSDPDRWFREGGIWTVCWVRKFLRIFWSGVGNCALVQSSWRDVLWGRLGGDWFWRVNECSVDLVFGLYLVILCIFCNFILFFKKKNATCKEKARNYYGQG